MPKKLTSPGRPLAELAADPQNPRTISDAALAGLGVSAQEFGDLSGIVWNRRTGQLVCGHQRVRALGAAGATAWFITGADGYIKHPQTGERFPIRVVDWDLTKQRIANLVANSPSIAGEFTAAAVEQVRALEEDALFESLRLDELQRALSAQFPSDGDAGAAGGDDDGGPPSVPAEPFTKRGDLWVMGDHRLLCGSATVGGDVAALLGGERPVLGLHDPPYGIGIQDGEGRIGGAKKEGSQSKAISRAKAYPIIAGDDHAFDPAHLLDTGATVVIWGANHFANLLPASAAWICWDKTLELGSTDFSDGELAWVSRGGRMAIFRMLWRGLIREGKAEDGPVRVHPTQKPIALYRWILDQYTQPGEMVYDAYGGSGPTLLAAEALGRRARVMELAPAYCDVIVARWEAKTGRKALLRRGNETLQMPGLPPGPSDSDDPDDALAF